MLIIQYSIIYLYRNLLEILCTVYQRYRRRKQQSRVLNTLVEHPEDLTTATTSIKEPILGRKTRIVDEDAGRQQLPSSWRLSVPDILQSRRSYDGIVQLQDICQFDYDSLHNRALTELRGSDVIEQAGDRSLSGDPRKQPSLSPIDAIVIACGGQDEGADSNTARLVLHQEGTHPSVHGAHFNSLFGARRHPLFTSFDTIDSITVGSARSYRSAMFDDDVKLTSSAEWALYSGEDGRMTSNSSISDVSTLQHVYGLRMSANTNASRMTSGTSTRNAPSSGAHRSARCSRAEHIGGKQRSMSPRRRSATFGSTRGVRFMLFNEFRAPEDDQHCDVISNGDSETSQTAELERAVYRTSHVTAPSKTKNKSSYQNGEISRAFVYSYFNLIPNIVS